jgi:hypothetical protein
MLIVVKLFMIQMKVDSYHCEQDTKELIHRIEQAMQNLIPLSVPDVRYLALQLRSQQFGGGIVFLVKSKCYQQINWLTCKASTNPADRG